MSNSAFSSDFVVFSYFSAGQQSAMYESPEPEYEPRACALVRQQQESNNGGTRAAMETVPEEEQRTHGAAMAHPSQMMTLRQIHMVEMAVAEEVGFQVVERPRLRWSHAALLSVQ